jgi:uronate dehydrogenase
MSFPRILVTGAAGRIGTVLRSALSRQCKLLRLSDIAPLGPPRPGEEVVPCDLADAAGVARLCEGIDAVVHLGGVANEAPWPDILRGNISGPINVYEGARLAGVDRIIFASSNHAIGMHPAGRTLDSASPVRPDSRYGLSKAFGEDLAALYAYKHGIRSLCLRIGTFLEKPNNQRSLSTWLSHGDFLRLITVGLTADYTFEIVYGVSNNRRSWWDNAAARRLGYEPQDDAEEYAPEVERIVLDNELDRGFQGGSFVSAEFSGRREWLS